jgi:hypothetical protein
MTMEFLQEEGVNIKGYKIAVSPNGWTDNEISMGYLKNYFDIYTRDTIRGSQQYRILIVDGHESHITLYTIDFYVKNKILLLCLPSHSTYLL